MEQMKKQRMKNSFIDIIIDFDSFPNYKYEIKESDVKNSNRFVRFELIPLKAKQEIKLNDFMKPELRKVVFLSEHQRSEIDATKMNTDYLTYKDFILELNKNYIVVNTKKYVEDVQKFAEHYKNYCRNKQDFIDRVTLYSKNKYYFRFKGHNAVLKKIPKKNCNTNFNKFSIKIINTKLENPHITLGIIDANFDVKSSGGRHFGYNFCCNGLAYVKNQMIKQFGEKCGIGDELSLKYDSIKGTIEIFKNWKSLGILTKEVDIKKDYYFIIILQFPEDVIEIIDNK